MVICRFDARLPAAAHAVQKEREYADYAPVRYATEEARATFETCERFMTAVDAMLGLEPRPE